MDSSALITYKYLHFVQVFVSVIIPSIGKQKSNNQMNE